jgi:hypothetical protein
MSYMARYFQILKRRYDQGNVVVNLIFACLGFSFLLMIFFLGKSQIDQEIRIRDHGVHAAAVIVKKYYSGYRTPEAEFDIRYMVPDASGKSQVFESDGIEVRSDSYDNHRVGDVIPIIYPKDHPYWIRTQMHGPASNNAITGRIVLEGVAGSIGFVMLLSMLWAFVSWCVEQCRVPAVVSTSASAPLHEQLHPGPKSVDGL